MRALAPRCQRMSDNRRRVDCRPEIGEGTPRSGSRVDVGDTEAGSLTATWRE